MICYHHMAIRLAFVRKMVCAGIAWCSSELSSVSSAVLQINK